MKLITALTLPTACIALWAFTSSYKTDSISITNTIQNTAIESTSSSDSITLSFVFVGCNRTKGSTDYPDKSKPGSTANLYALQRIFKESAVKKPDIFFFLGDMVKGLSDTKDLEGTLKKWKSICKDPKQNPLITNTEFIPLPGNHEMLTKKNKAGHEKILDKATTTWFNVLGDMLPVNRIQCPSNTDPGKDNRLTYTIVRNRVGFVVMNTDTHKEGSDSPGYISHNFINQQVDSLSKLSTIDHVFVLGHRPYYRDNKPNINDFTEGAKIWDNLEENKVTAMLSAHVHDWEYCQPKKGTYQIIAGNGGTGASDDNNNNNNTYPTVNFGYTTINIYASGRVELLAHAWDAKHPYSQPVEANKTKETQRFNLTWGK
jgi:predicted MPP superfamily phosphohydrolase